jgi:hypothetical protein
MDDLNVKMMGYKFLDLGRGRRLIIYGSWLLYRKCGHVLLDGEFDLDCRLWRGWIVAIHDGDDGERATGKRDQR